MARYFLHESGGNAYFWRSVQSFAGVPLHLNLNLLAWARGDRPPTGASLVSPVDYDTGVPGVGVVSLQPFVQVTRRGLSPLPLGRGLRELLDDPLGTGASMRLSLPVYDTTLGIGEKGGGWFRDQDNEGSFHCGWDVMPASQISNADLFEVCAAADGVVVEISKRKNQPIVLRHSRGGVEFLTVYQHLDLRSCPLDPGETVRRGQFLARITDERQNPDPAEPHPRHLHFMVAVRGPEFTLPSGVRVPQLWYAIDPFGVYDYYRNRTSLTSYNYVPGVRPQCFVHPIRGAVHPIQWAAEPIGITSPASRQTEYLAITRLQLRARRDDARDGVPPAERQQCLVWLEGIDGFFFVPFDSPGGNHMIELKLVDFLSQCFDRGRKVKLDYYSVAGERFIAAVWANAS